MHRHRIHDEPRQQGKCRKTQKEAQRKARAEYSRAVTAGHGEQLEGHQARKQRGERGVERQQQRVLLRKEGRIAARGGEQEQPHGRHGAPDDEQELHRSPCRGSRLSTGAGSCRGERTVKRFQGESSCSSRLVSALSWNGLGSRLVSRRMRTAAS